jgi:hypothetical protein
MNPWGELRRRAESFSGLCEILKIFCAKENAESERNLLIGAEEEERYQDVGERVDKRFRDEGRGISR